MYYEDFDTLSDPIIPIDELSSYEEARAKSWSVPLDHPSLDSDLDAHEQYDQQADAEPDIVNPSPDADRYEGFDTY